MYKRILAPLDGSEMAEQALPYVRFLAKDLQAKVELLRIAGSVPLEFLNNQALHPQDIMDAMRNEANNYLNDAKRRLDNIGLTVSVSVRDGAPAQEIVEAAEQEPDTIIAMTTHGRSGMARWVMGSVADKALHTTDCPFLLIKAREDAEIEADARVNSIIVPLDGSEFAAEALAPRRCLGQTPASQGDSGQGHSFPGRIPEVHAILDDRRVHVRIHRAIRGVVTRGRRQRHGLSPRHRGEILYG